ncbi:spore coat protein U domain-containing protein [Bacillus sp. NP157]|nr:spore coat protein U domain-containing protein [Bacillus sp. NP157]
MKTLLSALLALLAVPAQAGTTTVVIPVVAHVINSCEISQPPTIAFDNLDSAKGGATSASAGITCTKGATAAVRLVGPTELTDGRGNTIPYTVTDANGQPINATQGPSFTSATAFSPTLVPMTASIAGGTRVSDGDYRSTLTMTVDF